MIPTVCKIMQKVVLKTGVHSSMWICRSCEYARKFDTNVDYIAHQMSMHS